MDSLLLQDTDRTSDRQAQVANHLLASVSVIIPVGTGDSTWRTLLSSFSGLPAGAEIWLVGAEPQPADFEAILQQCELCCRVHWVIAEVGRARQMNAGATLSTAEFLWFLHADTRLEKGAVAALDDALATAPDTIHYFELGFQDDGPTLVGLNAWGVRIRSRFLGLPFGDQGLCMRRDVFERLGRFDETVPYGEDHLLIWAAHRAKVPLRSVAASITTSARKYRANGWLATTVLHGWRTWRQAIPQFVRYLWSRIR